MILFRVLENRVLSLKIHLYIWQKLVSSNALLIGPSAVKSLPANSEVEIWLIEYWNLE